jgi:polysaccharide export outer membrane protein
MEHLMKQNTTYLWLKFSVALALAPTCMPLVAQSASNKNGTAAQTNVAEIAAAAPAGAVAVITTPSKAHDASYVIGADDVLAINVWKEPEISRTIPVRSDGKISLPLVGEVQAGGVTPKQLESQIAKNLESYISEPEVTVIVQEVKSQRFNILGHVQKPGSYLLTPPMTVVDAIATAGGFRDFAKVKSIYVLRDDGGKQVRLPFNYKEVIKGEHSDQNIQLQSHDTVVVP